MKKYTILVLSLLLSAATYAQNDRAAYFASPASYSHANLARAERSYAACLASPNDGVIESALAHVAMLKLAIPGGRCPLLASRVSDLVRTASSPESRYKAFLVESVLTNPDMFAALARADYETPDEFFGAVASRLGEYYSAR